MRTASRRLPLVLLSVLAGACHQPSGVDFTAPPGSRTPSLAQARDGSPILTWFEPAGDGHRLQVALRRNGAWTPPRTVAAGRPFFVNWADFPSLAVATDGRWTVHWLERTAPSSYAYHVMLSSSADEGATWSDPVVAHEDRSNTEHGFVAKAATPDGAIRYAWLDGRETGGPTPGPMTLRSAVVGADGVPQAETLIDARTCDCCNVAMVNTTSGFLVAYRDRTDDEVRDIYTARWTNGVWDTPTPVAADGWVHRACPVNGPALAAHGDTVAIAWYSGADETPRLWAARSLDGGVTWSARIRLDDGHPIGRVEATPLPEGASAVIWLEGTADQARWVARRIDRDGTAGPLHTLAASAGARDVGFPRALAQGGDLFVAWTEPGRERRVTVHRLDPVSFQPRRP